MEITNDCRQIVYFNYLILLKFILTK